MIVPAIRPSSPISTLPPTPHMKFHVPNSDPSLDMTFWRFGAPIPPKELLMAAAKMGTEASDHIKTGGSRLLPFGIWKRGYRFASGHWINITIADHSQLGRPMNWYMVRDTIIGFALFMNDYSGVYEEVDFWVELDGVEGDVGWGDVVYGVVDGTTVPASNMSLEDPTVVYITPLLDSEAVLEFE